MAAHTRSRKKIPTGNLVFFDGAVFSQTALNLTSFPQLDVKIKEEAKKRLAVNPNDPIGLAENGDLELDDGKLNEAIALYNRCLDNQPNADTKAKAREKLYDAITELMQRDFNAGEKMIDQYKDLCSVEILETDDALKRQIKADEELHRKSNYFCLVAAGRESQGRLVEAFDYYLEFGSLTGNKELVSVIDQPNTYARPDVWALGRINHMMSKATPEQRKPLEERAAREWESVQKAGDLEKLRNFVNMFGTSFGSGSEARLMLAEKLIATNNDEDQRDAENILLGLKGLDDPAIAARATESLARLYIRKGLFDDAMGLYADLHRNYPKIVVRDGKTGADVFNSVITDKRFLPYLEPPRHSWGHNRLKAQEIPGFGGNQPATAVVHDQPGRRIDPVLQPAQDRDGHDAAGQCDVEIPRRRSRHQRRTLPFAADGGAAIHLELSAVEQSSLRADPRPFAGAQFQPHGVRLRSGRSQERAERRAEGAVGVQPVRQDADAD